MKTITIEVIQPDGASTVPNEIVAEKVMGWRMVGIERHLPQMAFSKLVVTMDSGQEYHVAEMAEDFKRRLRARLEVPSYGFTGFRPLPPNPRQRFYGHPCSSCGSHMRGLQLAFPNVFGVCEVIANTPADKEIQICWNCIIETTLRSFGPKP